MDLETDGFVNVFPYENIYWACNVNLKTVGDVLETVKHPIWNVDSFELSLKWNQEYRCCDICLGNFLITRNLIFVRNIGSFFQFSRCFYFLKSEIISMNTNFIYKKWEILILTHNKLVIKLLNALKYSIFISLILILNYIIIIFIYNIFKNILRIDNSFNLYYWFFT